MAYTKNTWVTGDIVTSEKLNHMEDGIEGSESVFIVGGVKLDVDGNINTGSTLDKTWQEIRDALQNKICIAVASFNDGFIQFSVSSAALFNGNYIVLIETSERSVAFSTSTPSGYPVNEVS